MIDRSIEWQAIAEIYSEAIQRVRELHYKDEYGFCSECYWQSDCLIEEYPCRTLKALDGEQ